MRLLKDRVLVKMNPSEIANSAGILLPVSMQERNIGTVVLTGPDVIGIKVGDKIKKFNDCDGVPIEYEGEKVLILRESESIELVY